MTHNVPPYRCCDYCTSPATGQHGNHYHCENPEHDEAAYRDWRSETTPPMKNRFWRAQQGNKHQRGEQ